MKPLVIYHDNCADGFGAAFAAWLKFGDEAEYVAAQYNRKDEAWRTDENLDLRDVYILDFSYPKEDMEYLFSVAKKVIWLDHHKTAFEAYGVKPNKPGKHYYSGGSLGIDSSKHVVMLDNNKSGAMIAWEYFHPGKEIPMLIKHIDDYDRWIFKLEGTKEFNKALWSYAPWTFEQWRRFLPIGDLDNLGAMKSEGAAILRAHDQNVQAVVKGAALRCSFDKTLGYEEKFKTEQWQDNLDGLAANCPPHLASDVGHQLAKQSGTYGLLWYINKEGKCFCSLRSNGDYDVSAIAKAFGGGGHKNAAGFEIDIQTLLEWIK